MNHRFIFVYIETKHQWARDDPAFLVLLSLYLCSKYLLHYLGIVVTVFCSFFTRIYHCTTSGILWILEISMLGCVG